MVSPLYLWIVWRHVLHLQGKVFKSKTKILPWNLLIWWFQWALQCKLCRLFGKCQNCPITYYFRQVTRIFPYKSSISLKGIFYFFGICSSCSPHAIWCSYKLSYKLCSQSHTQKTCHRGWGTIDAAFSSHQNLWAENVPIQMSFNLMTTLLTKKYMTRIMICKDCH